MIYVIMSYVISNELFTTSTVQSVDSQCQKQQIIMQSLMKTVKHLNNINGIDCQIRQSHNNHHNVQLLISLPFASIQKHCLLINFSIDTQLGFIKTATKIFAQDDGHLFKIDTKHQRVLLNKLIRKHQSIYCVKTKVDLMNGQVQFSLPYCYFCCYFVKKSQQEQNDGNKNSNRNNNKGQQLQLYNVINSTIKKVSKQCQILYEKIINLFPTNNNNSSLSSKTTATSQILRYINRSSIQPVFDISLGSSNYEKIENLQNNQQQQINQLLKHIDYDMTMFYSIKLFKPFDMDQQNCLQKLYTKDYFKLNDYQQQHLRQKLQHPLSSGKLYAIQPKFVYNIIQLHQPKNIKLKRISTGGFSQIYKSDAKFWYMMTFNDDKMQRMQKIFKEKQTLNKHLLPNQKLIQKRSIIKNIVEKAIVFKTSSSKINRIFYQQQIVSKFKSVSSIFLPEYYKLHNNQQQFQSYLIMQHLPFPTLNQYMEMNRCSVSFLTKNHLMLMIALGLKVLKDCQIVHLDLKPSNCIVTKRLIVKLIDFGESYCNEICNKNKQKYFKPAFTIPYGSPQIITNHNNSTKTFTQKSDMFSWSIMFFQLIFERLPFSFTKHLIHEKYHNGLYMDNFYYVPQQEQSYGQKELVGLMRLIIMKGLSMEENKRPYCNWIVIILKESLKYLVGLQKKWDGT